MGKGLSDLQKTILAELESETKHLNEAWRILGYIDDDEYLVAIPKSIFREKLRKKLSYSSPSISRAIARLEKRGLIVQEKEPWKRTEVIEWIELANG